MIESRPLLLIAKYREISLLLVPNTSAVGHFVDVVWYDLVTTNEYEGSIMNPVQTRPVDLEFGDLHSK